MSASPMTCVSAGVSAARPNHCRSARKVCKPLCVIEDTLEVLFAGRSLLDPCPSLASGSGPRGSLCRACVNMRCTHGVHAVY